MGEVFAGRYQLVDPLGEGGTGRVWRAWDHRQGRYVAAKVLHQSDAWSLLRFVREQSFRIEHPHVVTPLGWAGDDDRVLYTMPIVRGGSVSTLLGDFGPLPPSWVAVLVDQLLQALSAVHHMGLVHRDVKPANMLLEPTGRNHPYLRLSDFGVAAPVSEPRLTRVSQVIGTPGYLAPEQLRGAAPRPAQDLYAVGVVTVEMLTGVGLGGEEGTSWPERPSGCPDSLWQLTRALAASDIADRPASAASAMAALRDPGLPSHADPRDSEVEVFDQVPELPPGWDRHGPIVSNAPPHLPSPTWESAFGETGSAPGSSARRGRRGLDAPSKSDQKAREPGLFDQPSATSPAQGRISHPRRRRVSRLRVASAAVLAVVGVILLTVATLLVQDVV